MDAAEKRRLKKLGKQQVERQSQELRERLAESNPAPLGSDEWAKNYRQATLKEKELRQQQPDLIHAKELERDFVLNPIPPVAHVVPTYYIQCLHCHDVLHSCPTVAINCSCKRLSIAPTKDHTVITAESEAAIQWAKLIGRAKADLGFEHSSDAQTVQKHWWQFWK